jgi:hypothetical protein
MSRYLRYLRLLCAALCGTACVLLCVLWARSYSSSAFVVMPLPDPFGSVLFETAHGRVTACAVYGQRLANGNNASPWGIHYKSLDEWEPGRPPLAARANFTVSRWKQFYCLILPHWFLAITTGLLGVLFFQKHSLRFSLRTLLIATTLLAILLGTIIARSR